MKLWSAKGAAVPVEFKIECDDRLKWCTAEIYTELYAKEYEGKTYLSARKKTASDCGKGELYFTAPEGALVFVDCAFGSRRRTRVRYRCWFKVGAGEKVEEESEEWRVKAENMLKLGLPTKKDLSVAEAKILNTGMVPSKFAPVRSLYHFATAEIKESENPQELAVIIAAELVRKRPDVLRELGFDPEKVARALLGVKPSARSVSERARALMLELTRIPGGGAKDGAGEAEREG